MRKLLMVVAALLIAAGPASTQTKRPATFDDVMNVKAIQGVTVSPDGRQVVYGVREWVSEQDPSTPLRADGRMEARTHVWKVSTDGSAPARQITFGDKGESGPQFSPDGKYISFLTARGGADAKSQIYLMPIEGGEAWKLTDAKEGITAQQGYTWAPDSATIAFVTTDPRRRHGRPTASALYLAPRSRRC